MHKIVLVNGILRVEPNFKLWSDQDKVRETQRSLAKDSMIYSHAGSEFRKRHKLFKPDEDISEEDEDAQRDDGETINSVTCNSLPEMTITVLLGIKVCLIPYCISVSLIIQRFRASLESLLLFQPSTNWSDGSHKNITKIKQALNYIPLYKGTEWNATKLFIWNSPYTNLGMLFVLLAANGVLWHSIYRLKRRRAILTLGLMLILEVMLVFMAILLHFTSTCNMDPLLEEVSHNFNFTIYKNDNLIKQKVHDLQLNVGCCGWKRGPAEWVEAVNNNEFETKPRHNEEEEEEKIDPYKGDSELGQWDLMIPYSCCKYPWSANLWCGAEEHYIRIFQAAGSNYNDPVFQRFYSTQPCSEALVERCRFLRDLIFHTMYVTAVMLVLDIIVSFLVHFHLLKLEYMRLQASSFFDPTRLEVRDSVYDSTDSAEEEFTVESDTSSVHDLLDSSGWAKKFLAHSKKKKQTIPPGYVPSNLAHAIDVEGGSRYG